MSRENSSQTLSDRGISAATELGWIIVGRRIVVVGPQTARNGVVAIDPDTTRSVVAWHHGLAGTNDDMSRFGKMPSCGGVRRSTESDQKAQYQASMHLHFRQLISPAPKLRLLVLAFFSWCEPVSTLLENAIVTVAPFSPHWRSAPARRIPCGTLRPAPRRLRGFRRARGWQSTAATGCRHRPCRWTIPVPG
jgi:hypothetical protein